MSTPAGMATAAGGQQQQQQQDSPRREIAIFWDFENVSLSAGIILVGMTDYVRMIPVTPCSLVDNQPNYVNLPLILSCFSSASYQFPSSLSHATSFPQVHLPSWANPADASKAIVSAVSKYGRIVDRRLYFDMQGTSDSSNGTNGGGYHWSALDSSGFDLVNTPRRNQKETLDKKMIADVLTFAWDSAVRNDHCKPCVVLLTSDGDYAYTLSKLRDRGVMSVVMTGPDSSVANILKAAADIPLSFEGDVLSTIKGNNIINKKGMAMVPGNNLTAKDDDALNLCKITLRELSKNAQESPTGSWLLGSKLAASFRAAFFKGDNMNTAAREAFKDRYRQGRELAIQKGFLERGHKLLTGPDQGTIIVTSVNGKSNSTVEKLSLEDFFRVTLRGQGAVDGKTAATVDASTKSKIFFKNIPSTMKILDFVRYLENEHNVEVVRGNTFKGPPNAPFIFGSVQLTSELDALRLVGSKMVCNGRVLEVQYDSSRPTLSTPHITLEHSYERPCHGNIEGDDVFAFCKALSAFMSQEGFDGSLRGDWADGGFLNILKVPGNKLFFGGDKDRIKKSRAAAIGKMYLEVGRRVKVTGDIEAVTKETTDFSRHAPELYLRLTTEGKQFLDQSKPFNCGSKMPQPGAQHLFIKYLPASTEVKEFVEFVESVHDCSVERMAFEATKPWSSSTQAHIELTNLSDAAKILRMASCSDGFVYKSRSLVVLPDKRLPVYPGNDPNLFYEKDNISTANSTVSSLSLTNDGQEQKNYESSERAEPLSVSGCDYVSLFCRVIYERCGLTAISEPGIATPQQQWTHTANVAEEFQKQLKLITSEETKDAYKTTRHTAITTNLVEMGRRVLTSQSREIKLVPYFSGGRPAPNLSIETYFRLTTTGMDRATSVPSLTGELTARPRASKNMFLQNLPKSTDIQDFVTYLESTYQVSLRLACLANISPFVTSASVHLEFKKAEDYNQISKICKDQGLIYGGRALTMKVDKFIPTWSKCKPHLLYEKLSENGDEEEEKVSESKETDSKVSDANLGDAPQSEEKRFDSTNLLYGDNLALLYAQGAKMTGSPTASFTETVVSLPEESEEILPSKTETRDDVRDLLWE